MNPLDSIQDELKAVAPYLSSLPKSHPFNVPVDYFEELEVKLSTAAAVKFSVQDSIFDLKQHPFNVPENYFEELSSSIFSKIKNGNQNYAKARRTIPVANFFSGNYRLLLVAASVALLVVLSFFLFKQQQPVTTASANSTEVLQSDLLYAADLDDAVVVEMYLLDQQQNSQVAFDNASGDATNYLREAADIDATYINEL